MVTMVSRSFLLVTYFLRFWCRLFWNLPGFSARIKTRLLSGVKEVDFWLPAFYSQFNVDQKYSKYQTTCVRLFSGYVTVPRHVNVTSVPLTTFRWTCKQSNRTKSTTLTLYYANCMIRIGTVNCKIRSWTSHNHVRNYNRSLTTRI